MPPRVIRLQILLEYRANLAIALGRASLPNALALGSAQVLQVASAAVGKFGRFRRLSELYGVL